MPLAPGTALQNGHYVVDALLEAAPNGDLYWGTHVVVGMPVFIQIFPVGESAQSDLSSLMARLEGVAFAPKSPLPNPCQLFHGDNQTLCLAMGATVGLPWSTARQNGAPLSPKQALKIIRQIAADVTWLKQQGISGLDLSPNRVWLSADQQVTTLTGLPHAYLQNTTTTAAAPDTSVQSLAKLLFSFLTGQLPPPSPEADHISVREQLQTHYPNLSPVIVAAIEQGWRSPNDQPPLTLTQWLAQLPDAVAIYPVQTPRQPLTQTPSAPVNAPLTSKAVSSLSKPLPAAMPALAGTALFAAIAGVALGTYWRLNAHSFPGVIQLDPEQSFPTQADWPGGTPKATFDEPYIPAQNVPISQDEWVEEPITEVYESPTYESIDETVEPIDNYAPEDEFNPDLETDYEAPSETVDQAPVEPSPSPFEAPLDEPQMSAPDVVPAEPFERPQLPASDAGSSNVSNTNETS